LLSNHFEHEYPDVEFIPLGGAGEVVADRMNVGAAVQAISTGTKVTKLIDRDDKNETRN
jgi:tetrahydromethanopterin S-methyltransferase subunit D